MSMIENKGGAKVVKNAITKTIGKYHITIVEENQKKRGGNSTYVHGHPSISDFLTLKEALIRLGKYVYGEKQVRLDEFGDERLTLHKVLRGVKYYLSKTNKKKADKLITIYTDGANTDTFTINKKKEAHVVGFSILQHGDTKKGREKDLDQLVKRLKSVGEVKEVYSLTITDSESGKEVKYTNLPKEQLFEAIGKIKREVE